MLKRREVTALQFHKHHEAGEGALGGGMGLIEGKLDALSIDARSGSESSLPPRRHCCIPSTEPFHVGVYDSTNRGIINAQECVRL